MSTTLRRVLMAVLALATLAAVGALSTGTLHAVTTRGVSMEPTYHQGELVILARADTYHVGQIVAYRDAVTHVVVLHRIIDGDAAGWTLKGDNNQSTDVTHPTSKQLIGHAVVHVAKIGALVASPVALTATTTVLALLFVGMVTLLSGRITIRSGSRAARSPARQGRGRRAVRAGLVALNVVLALALAAGFVFAARPANTEPVRHQIGSFRYRATTQASDTYPGGSIETGEPVFLKLVHTVEVRFDYRVDGGVGGVTGSAGLDLNLSSASGWHTSIPLMPAADLIDSSVQLTGSLDLDQIRHLADRVTSETGVPTAAITLIVRAHGVITTPTSDGHEFVVELPFQLTPLMLTPTGPVPTASPTGPVVVTDQPIPNTNPRPGAPDGVSSRTRQMIVIALLLSIAVSVVLWPAHGSTPEPTDPATPTRVHAVSVLSPGQYTLVKLADQTGLEAVARELNSAIIEHRDGWAGVLTAHVLYWAMTSKLAPSHTIDPPEPGHEEQVPCS